MYNQRNATFWVGMLIVVLAGAWTIVHLIWNFAGQTADDYWGIALLILFVLALILSFVQYAQERSTLKRPLLRTSDFLNLRSRGFSWLQQARLCYGLSSAWTLVLSGYLLGEKRLPLLFGEQVEKQ